MVGGFGTKIEMSMCWSAGGHLNNLLLLRYYGTCSSENETLKGHSCSVAPLNSPIEGEDAINESENASENQALGVTVSLPSPGIPERHANFESPH